MGQGGDEVGIDVGSLVGAPESPDAGTRVTGQGPRRWRWGRRATLIAMCALLVVGLAGTAAVLALREQRAVAPAVMEPITHEPLVRFSRPLITYFESVGMVEGDVLDYVEVAAFGTYAALTGTLLQLADPSQSSRQEWTQGLLYTDQYTRDKVVGYTLGPRVVAILDALSGAPLWAIAAPEGSTRPLLDPAGILTFSPGERGVTASLRDVATGDVRATVDLGEQRVLATGAGRGRAYILTGGDLKECHLSVVDMESGGRQELGVGWPTCGAEFLGVWAQGAQTAADQIAIGQDIGVIRPTGMVFDLATGQIVVPFASSTAELLPHDRLILADQGGESWSVATRAGKTLTTATCPLAGDILPLKDGPWAVALSNVDWGQVCNAGDSAGAVGYLPADSQAWSGHLVHGVALVNGVDGSLTAYDVADGRVLWAHEVGEVDAVIGTDMATAIVLEPDVNREIGMLRAVNLADGSAAWSRQVAPFLYSFGRPATAIPRQASLLVVTDGYAVERWDVG